MNAYPVQVQSEGMGMLWAILTTLFTVAMFVYWAIVAWRAMRAHERIAACLEQRLPR